MFLLLSTKICDGRFTRSLCTPNCRNVVQTLVLSYFSNLAKLKFRNTLFLTSDMKQRIRKRQNTKHCNHGYINFDSMLSLPECSAVQFWFYFNHFSRFIFATKSCGVLIFTVGNQTQQKSKYILQKTSNFDYLKTCEQTDLENKRLSNVSKLIFILTMLCISRFLIRCYIYDVRNNAFLNCNFAKLLKTKYKSVKFWTTFLQLGVGSRKDTSGWLLGLLYTVPAFATAWRFVVVYTKNPYK